MSLKLSIYNLIKNSTKPVSGTEVEDYARTLVKPGGGSYKASNASRRLRELEEDEQIKRIPGYYASYTTPERYNSVKAVPTQKSWEADEPLFDNAPEVPAKPVTLSKKVSTLWEGARSRVGGRPRYSERSQAGPSERFSESTALVQELSRLKDFTHSQEPNYILREGA